ncbi:VanZ family protein [Paenibacillus sp. PK3_47]|uniref:VanZ family protein n=1 Tax=Paenibacillus sp. PK3_47 TaxID=2072642 RepID=UPI003183F19D
MQYRRHGYINKIRALVLYLLLLYLLNAFYLIMLPFPASRHNLPLSGNLIQPVPLQFLQDIADSAGLLPETPSSYLTLLREPAFYQAVFNVILTIPFGIFLGYYFQTRWVVCILLSFVLSLMFEITQITGIYGYFDHPYRIFDVDDLITNTLGGIIGYRIALWISGLLPKIDQLDSREDLSAKKVSYTRRAIAFMTDFFVWVTGALLINSLSLPGAYWISTFIYFVLIPYVTRGRTLGKWIVRIRISGLEGRTTLWSLTVRYVLLYGIWLGAHTLIINPSWSGHLDSGWTAGIPGLLLICDMIFCIHLALKVFKRDPVLFYERISGTTNAITWPEKQRELADYTGQPSNSMRNQVD